MKHLIATMETDEMNELINQAINEGKLIANDPHRLYAEAWLRGWCDERTTQSFKEALVIFLHNHITKHNVVDMERVMMSKEAFVGIIKAIQDQRKREEKFCEAISQAFVDAGDLAEFHQPSNFTPPTKVFIDNILESLAKAFVSDYQSYENSIDLINYFMYELDTMGYVFMEPIDPSKNTLDVAPVPAYYNSSNGKKVPLSTPEELYDALVYEMLSPHEKEYHQPNEQDMIHSVLPDSTNSSPILWDNEKQAELWDKLKPIIEDELGVKDIHPMDTLDELGADSLDSVELIMAIEQKFNISITDFERESFTTYSQCRDLVPLIESKLAN